VRFGADPRAYHQGRLTLPSAGLILAPIKLSDEEGANFLQRQDVGKAHSFSSLAGREGVKGASWKARSSDAHQGREIGPGEPRPLLGQTLERTPFLVKAQRTKGILHPSAVCAKKTDVRTGCSDRFAKCVGSARGGVLRLRSRRSQVLPLDEPGGWAFHRSNKEEES